MERTHLIEVCAEFIVILGIGTAVTYWIRGDLEFLSLISVVVIGFILLFLDESKNKGS